MRRPSRTEALMPVLSANKAQEVLILFISFYLMVIFPLIIWPTAQSLCQVV